MATTTAEVQVLTAEVRVLMVGSRQVTLSVFRQLDRVEPTMIQPFGRVRDKYDDAECAVVVGVGTGEHVGQLVRSSCRKPPNGKDQWFYRRRLETDDPENLAWSDQFYWEWQTLPLIILAGLR